MIIKVFGQILRELRVSKQLSQEKLAELADLDRTYISLLERGQRQPTIRTLFQIAKALNIKPSKIIETVEEKANF